jgi:hypothetical protein
MRTGPAVAAGAGCAHDRQPVRPLRCEVVDVDRDHAVAGVAPGQPHPQPAERDDTIRVRREAQRRPGGGLVGDRDLPRGRHTASSLPPFPTDQHASHPA